MGFVDKQPSRIQGQWFLVESMKYGFFEQAERPYIGLMNDYWRQIHPKGITHLDIVMFLMKLSCQW